MWNLLPLPLRLGIAAAGIIAILGSGLGVYAYVRHQGYVDGVSDATAACEKQKRDMEAANKAAADEAAKNLDELTKALELKGIVIDDILKGIDLASDAEPGATEQCLSAPATKRLSQIQ